MLQVNADDLGWSAEGTDKIISCYKKGRIHSCSAMTLMQDSQRAAALALEDGLPTGLHLNLTDHLTGEGLGSTLMRHHRAVADYLGSWKYSQVIMNPFLTRSFDYVFKAQWDEYCRLFGREPERLDGHHHMHLCMNMLASGLLKCGLRIRRNFTFRQGEKGVVNRTYRTLVDRWLRARYACADMFFSIAPIESANIQRILTLSGTAAVELMVHPGVESEYRFLMSDGWLRALSTGRASLGDNVLAGLENPQRGELRKHDSRASDVLCHKMDGTSESLG